MAAFSRMGYDQENPVKSVLSIVGRGAIGGLGGFVLAKTLPPLFWFGIRKLNPHAQVPIRKYTPTMSRIGQGVMLVGGLMGRPEIMGMGGGLIASDIDNSVFRKEKWIKEKGQHPLELNMIRYEIPDWLPA